ncbi:putative ent-kaurene oxidase [Rosellinia necatrix]|uniref:Putative ent-kaurene oxidase n=1 Tax=Rosellinia necatrix TaxID=77044 RepID=A0A1S8AB06_ROSNE|nr:putative ent-kaurene oxidase [Rosellinia necatrix]
MYYSKAIGKICIAHIEKRIQDTTNTHSEPGTRLDHKDGLQTIIDHAISTKDPTQLSPDLISERLLITNNVTLHGLTFTLQNLILNLVSTDPSHGYIETLRDECRGTLSGAAGKWNLEAVWKLKLLDSAIRESMRITPFSSMAMARTVIDPEGITVEQGDSNIIIPHGTLLALPVERIHMDQDRYQNPYEFNPFRFVSFSSQDDKKPKDQDYTTTKATTTPDDQFLYFGTTKNPCPGRFFAVYQLKLVMAHLLLNYDLEYSSKKVNLSDMLAMKVPQMDAKLRVRKLD